MRNAFILAVLVSVLLAVACPPQVLAQTETTIEATMEDELQKDQDSDNQADPGDTLRYTITITHTGKPEEPAATKLQVTVPLDPNTTLVPGMLRSTPVGVADSYDTVINVDLTVAVDNPTTDGVLANDINLDEDPLAVVEAETPQTTTLGGTVVFTTNGGFTYTPPPGAMGVDTFTYTVTDLDGNDPTPTTVTIGINVNVAPSFVKGPDQTVREDAGRQIVRAWATALSTGPPREAEQTLLAFRVDTDNDALFTVLPAISVTTGNLTYTLAPDANGTATVTVRLQDDGGIAGGGEDTSDPQTFTITVTAVNDRPAFTAGPSQTVLEDAEAQTVPGWAKDITAGPDNEAGQTLTFHVSPAPAALFAVPPAINPETGDLTYRPATNANGTATVTVRLRDNGGTADEGVDTSLPQTFTVTITAVNDPPSFVAGPAQTVPEDAGPQTVAGWATALSPGPANEAGQALTAFLVSTDNDALFAARPAISPTTGTLTYRPAANAHGVANVTVRLQDDGGIANDGVAISAPQTFAITVAAVNDAPVNTVPETQTTVEDTPLPFSTATANLIRIRDPDGASGLLVVTLHVTDGTLTLHATQGLTFTDGDGTDDTTMRFSGTLTAINTALDGLIFTPVLHFNGVSTLRLTTTDPDAPGGALSDTDRVLIRVTAVNDAPEHTVPGPQTTPEDVALVFNAADGNALSVSDVDAGEGSLEVTLSVTRGRLTLGDTTDLSFTAGDGTADATMTFTGTLTAINTALEGMVFIPPQNVPGESTLDIVTSDQGNTGDGGPQSDTDAVTIAISAVNDAPVNTVPGPQETGEDQALELSAEAGNALSIADVDAEEGPLEVTLEVTPGRLTLNGIAGLTFTTGDGTNDAAMTFTGTLTAMNTALDGLRFTPRNGFVGESRLDMSTSDQGNTGSGGAQSDTATVRITVVEANDAPVNTVPGPQFTPQDVVLIFGTVHGNALSISDVDAGDGFLLVTLSVTAGGSLTLNGTTGLTFTVGDGSTDATMTFSGTLANINSALEGLVFTPSDGFRGNVTLELITSDQGHTGAGGPQTDSDTVLIVVGTRNNPPVNTVPEPQTIPEDTVLVFTTDHGNRISISDPDVSTGALAVTLSVTSGTLTLGSTTGLTFTEGDGTADTAMSFTGILAAINTALDGLVFTPPPDFADSSIFQLTSDDQGNTGSGGPQTDTDMVLITVTAVNDAPVNRVPVEQTTPEDVALVFNAANNNVFSVSDVDADPGALAVTLKVTRGRLTLSSTAGLTFTDGDGTDDPTMTFSGTLTAINTALDGLVFTPLHNFSGNSMLQLATSDQGNIGAGGAQSDLDTVTITITAVNDAPVNSVPGPQATTPGAALIFNTANTNLISVRDVDVGTGLLEVTLSVTVGTLTLSGTAGLTFTAGDGLTDRTMTFAGTLTDSNAALDGLVFTPPALFDGDSTLQLVTTDQGNSGSGGPQSDTDTVRITVSAVNDAPVNTVPDVQTLSEGAVLVFSTSTGNAISISDSDAGAGLLAVTLSITTGTLSLSGTTGLTFTDGDGTADAMMTFTGTLVDINTALEGLEFTPPARFTGPVTLELTTNDQGHTGGGGPQSDTDTVTITVTAVNDAPVNTVPGPQVTAEDVTLVFSTANGNALSTSDTDVRGGDLAVTLSITRGTLSLDSTTDLTFTEGDGAADTTMTFTGTLAAINTALERLVFTPDPDFSGDVTLEMLTDDQGNTGSGGSQTDTDTIRITVTAVNDAPVNLVPGEQTTAEDTGLTFTAGNGNLLMVSDVDAGAGLLTVTLSVTRGFLTLSTTAELTFTDGDGRNDRAMTFSGTLTNINTALDGLLFTPPADFSGVNTVVQLSTSDQGNTGAGGAQSDSDTVAITVTAVNDPPVNTVPFPQATPLNTPVVFTAANGNALRVSDVDVGAGLLQVILSITNGTLTLGDITDLTFTAGDGTADPTMTFTGTLAAINMALEGTVFTPPNGFRSDVTLQLTTSDQGNTGAGGPQSDTDPVLIAVGTRNDPPINVVPGSQTTPEDVALVFNVSNGNSISTSDPDIGTGPLAVTLSVTAGTLTLSRTTDLTFTEGDGMANARMVFTGTLTAINAALDGLVFAPPADFVGDSTLEITTNDQNFTGGGGAQSDTDSVRITVTAVNDPPVNSVPAAQTTREDVALVFTAANDNLVLISDVDAGPRTLAVTLSVTAGTLTLGSTTGLTFTEGDGVDDATIRLMGRLAAINTALDGLMFTPPLDFADDSVFRLTTNDQGNTGSGGPQTDTDTVLITVTAVNDAPVNTVPEDQTTPEDVDLVFNVANNNVLSVSDVDAGANPLAVTLQVTRGRLTLNGTGGLTFSDGDGTADAIMTFTGTRVAINTALDGLVFTPPLNFSGPSMLQLMTNDQGHTGSGGAQSDTDTVTLTITAVNDAPVNAVPGPQATTPGVALIFNAANNNLISITDVDAALGMLEVTLSVTIGTLTLSGTAGLTFSDGDGTADAIMTFTGTLPAINTALEGLVFTPPGGFDGNGTLELVTSDQGHSGSGGSRSDTDTVTLIVSAVNDAPVNTVPGAQTIAEGAVLVFSTPTGNAISVSDSDAGSGLLGVTLNVPIGTLSLSGTTGLVFTEGDGTADAMMTFMGTLVDINTALEGLEFTPPAGFIGPVTLRLTTNDRGNTGGGGPQTDIDTIRITVTAVNDAPVNTVPGAQSTPEDVALVFSTANGNQISIADVDVGTGLLEIALSVTDGHLTLSGITGLTFTEGDGTADAMMTFTGTLTNINTALEGLIFTPAPDFADIVTLQLATDDQGHTGSGGAQSDTDTIRITVTAVNDAPVNTVPGAQSTPEDVALVFSTANGNQISIADVDVGTGLLEIALSVTDGHLTLSGITGLTFTEGDGTADAMMTFTGTLANINTALEGLIFTPAPDFADIVTLQLATNDQGHTGSGGAQSDTDTVTITVTAVNDAPVNTVPGAQATVAGVALTFNAANNNLIRIRDVDSGLGRLEVSLRVADGTLTLSGTTDLSFTVGDGTTDATMTFTGTQVAINTALDGLVFTPPSRFDGDVTLHLATDDQGNTGSGGRQQDTDTVTITVSAANEAPVNTVPGAQTTPEDVALVFSAPTGNAISISDIDAGSGLLAVTLDVTAGQLTLSGIAGLTFTTGDGSNDAIMTFTGTLADINTALEGLIFTPPANFTDTSTLQLLTNDQGHTGDGGPLSATDTVTINVTAVNDAPVHSVPGTQTTAEDVALGFNTGNGNLLRIRDVDAGTEMLEVSLRVTDGTLTLSGTAGLTFTVGSGTDEATMTFTGTLADLNAALDGLVFTPAGNFTGDSLLELATNDRGHTGDGGPLSATDTVTINVTAVNDAPVHSVPGTQTTAEDVALGFNTGNGNLLRIRDVDAGTEMLEVSLRVTDGTLTLSGTAGLTFTVGSGTDEATMTFTGTLADLNAALDGLVFTPAGNFTGDSLLELATNDRGHTGDGGPLSATDTVTINVTAVNDAPVLTAGATLAYVENQAATALDTTVTVSDVDTPTLASVTVQITDNYQVGEDVLSFTDQLGITGSFADTTGTLTLTGPAPLGDFQTALRTVTYRNTADAPDTGARTIRWIANDGATVNNFSTPVTSTVTISAINDAPVLTAGATLAYTENQAATVIDTTITVNDSDTPTLAQVTVQITGNYQMGADILSFTNQPGITGSFDTATGMLTLARTGPALLADFETALRTVRYRNTSETPDPAPRTIRWIADDGETTNNQSAPVTSTITVTAVNDAPSFTIGPNQTVLEDAVAQTINPWATAISDGEDGTQTLTFNVTDNTNPGLFAAGPAVAADGTLTYRPAANANGTATLTLELQDNGGTANGGMDTSPAQTFTITVTAVNDAPSFTAGPDQTVLEDTGLQTVASWATDLSAGPSDEAGQTLAFVVTDNTNPGLFAAGPAVAADGTLTYRPAANANGTATLTLELQDNGGTANGGADTSLPQTFTITITAVNDAPTAVDDTPATTNPTTDEATALNNIAVLGNDSDTDGPTSLVVNSVNTAGTLGQVTNNGMDITYDPNGQFESLSLGATATDTFIYQVCDSFAPPACDSATVTVTITGLNDAPVLNASGAPSLLTIDQDAFTNTGVFVSDLLAPGTITDPDAVALEGIAVTAVDNTNGEWQYNLGALWVAFGSALADTNATLLEATARIRFVPNGTFTGVIDPGLTFRAWDQTSVAMNGATGVDVSVNGDTTAFSAITETASITVDPVPQDVTYDAVGNTELVVGTGGPGPAGNAFTTAPNGVLATTPTLTVVAGTFPTDEGGSVTIDAQGRFTYTPQAGDTSDSFTYTVGSGRQATVTINLTERVWYVQNNVSGPGPGTGTSSDPFQALQSAEADSAAGDTIFVFLGTGTTLNQDAGITLQDNQRLLGHYQGTATTFTVGTATTVTINTTIVGTPNPGDQPAISNINPNASGVTVPNSATGVVEITGLNITGEEHGIAVIAAGALTIEIRDNTLTGGAGDGINVVTSGAGAAVALSLDDNVLAAQATAGAGARLDGSAGGTLTITNFANNRVDGAMTEGTGIIVTSAIFDATPGGMLNPVNAGTLAIGTDDTTRVGEMGMVLSGVSGDLVFGTLEIFSSDTGLQATGTGAFTGAAGFRLTTASSTTIDAEDGPALDLSNLSLTDLQGSMTSTNSLSTGISLNNVDGTVTLTSSTITNPSGTAFSLSGGTVDGTYGGSITKSGGTGFLVNIAGHAAGRTVTFQNGSTLTATNSGGIVLNNVDGTVRFNGTTTLTGGNAGVAIQNGSAGTVTFTTATITNSSGTGTAFSVDGGAANITYSGEITKDSASSGLLVSVTGGYTGTLTFETGTLQATVGDGILLNNVDGTVRFNGPTTLTGATPRVAIQNGSAGTVTFDNATITNSSGTDTAFSIAGNSTANVTYNGSITKSGGGLLVSVASHATGTLTFGTGTTLQAMTGGGGIQLDNADGTVQFAGTTTLNGGGARIAITGSDGIITFGTATTITNPTGVAFSVSGGSPTVAYNGSITDTSDLAVSVASTTGGVVTLQRVTSSAAGIAISDTAGAVTIADADLSEGATVSIANNTAAVTFNDLQINHSTGAANAVNISGGSGNVTITANTATGIQSTVNRLVNITERAAGGNVTFEGTLQGTGTSTGISVSEATGDNTVEFKGAVDLGLNGSRLTGPGLPPALTVDNNGQAGAVVSFANLDIFTSGRVGINASGGGTLNVISTDQINTSSGGATGLQLSGLEVGMTLSSVTVDTIGSLNTGLNFNNVSGSFTVTGTTTLNSMGIGIAITGGTGAMTFGQVNINNRNNIGIAIDGGGQTVQFGATTVNNQNITPSVTPAINVANRTGSTLSFTPAVVAMNNVAATGINLSSNAGTITFGAGSSLSGSTGTAFNVNGGAATVTYNGNITSTSGRPVAVASVTGGAVTFQNGTISATNQGILVQTNTGGSTTFNGASKVLNTGANTAVTLTNNSGHTINFTNGGLDIDTTTATGFSASGGGTINVTGTVNTLDSVSATALNVASTTIGASNLNFQRISAGNSTAAADPVNGIVLNNTGALGGLTVTGNSAGLCGGGVSSATPPATVVAPVTADCSGGTIQNSTGPGVSLTNTSNVSLTRMRINNGSDDGIRGIGVNGFTLASSLVEANGPVGSPTFYTNLDFGEDQSGGFTGNFVGLTGTASITNSTIRSGSNNNVLVRTRDSSTRTLALTITGSVISGNPANAFMNDGILLEASQNATITSSVTGNVFSASKGDHFQSAASNNGNLNITFSNNTLTGGHSTALGAGVTINAATGVAFGGGYSGRVDYDINGNHINGATSNGVSVVLGTSSVAAVFDGFIRNNIIGTSGSALSCSTQANGLGIDARGNGTHNVSVTGNTIRQCFDRGILAEAGDGDSVLNLTVTGNLIDQQVDAGAREAIQTNFGITTTNVFGNIDTNNVCLQLGGAGALANVFSHGGGAPDDFRLRNRFEATVRLPGYGGSEDDTAAVVLYVQGRNTGSAGEPGSATASATAGAGYFGGAACTLPSP